MRRFVPLLAEFASPEEGEGWFALYEDETRLPADIDVLSQRTFPGPEIGEASDETTTVVELRDVGGQLVTHISLAFRIDTFYVTVQLQTPAENDTGGTPSATPAIDPQRVRLANDVASSLVARIEAVLAGQEVSGVDQSLAPLMLPIDQAWPYPGVAVEGYKDAPQVLGTGGPSAAFADAFEGAYSRTAYPGTGPSDLYPVAPTVTVSLSRFSSPEAAMRVLDGADALPIPGPLAPQIWQQVETESVSEADASRVYRSAYRPGGPVDSARVALVTGDHVVTVDVQGAASEAAARTIAEDLATQQAVCVLAGTSCQHLSVPDTRGAGAEGTPAAATPTLGDDGITVLEPDEPYAGATLDEWNARFWQWLVTLPISVNPFFEPTGAYCGYGQFGPVFFIPGVSTDRITMTCIVPEGTAIFVFIDGSACSTVEPPPYFGRDEAEMRACAAEQTYAYSDLQATINGVEIRDLERYRSSSPLFTITLPEGNIFRVTPGVGLSVADSYGFIIAPPPPGEYEVTVSGTLPPDPEILTASLRFVVEAPQIVEPETTPPPATP
jgi:hypothetical protein